VNAGAGTRVERVGEVSPARSAVSRGLLYFVFWLVLMPSQKPGDLALGLLAAAGATWLSLRLLPPETGRLRFAVMLVLMPHFLFESVRAGVDVARRALAPQPRLNPGFVDCPMAFPPGLARNTFATISSLLPGSVPCGESDGEHLLYHCIDVSEPVIEQLCAEERVLARALVAGQSHV
jgi:multicomponent Na+:H+ antiporter subunit E